MVVAVMVMAMRSDLFWLRRRAAAMCRLAARGLELDRRMGNAELSAKPAVQSLQNAGALRHRHLVDGYVAGESVRLRTEAPHMQIVHVPHAVDRLHSLADCAKADVTRRSFQKDVQRLADNTDRTPNDHRGNQEREDW